MCEWKYNRIEESCNGAQLVTLSDLLVKDRRTGGTIGYCVKRDKNCCETGDVS